MTGGGGEEGREERLEEGGGGEGREEGEDGEGEGGGDLTEGTEEDGCEEEVGSSPPVEFRTEGGEAAEAGAGGGEAEAA